MLTRLPETANLNVNQVTILGIASQKLLEAYAKDDWLKNIKTYLKTKKPDLGKRFIVPNDETIEYHFFRMIHDSPIGGHLGLEKTMDKLTRVFYWKNMQDDVIRYLQACQACQMVKPMKQSKFGLLQPLPILEQPWEQVSMDFITGLPLTIKGNDSILVFVDRLTKMVRVAATTTNCDSRTTANLFMEHVFRSYGVPKTIVSDRDIRFASAFWSDLLNCLGSRSLMSTAFHPQTDGQTERANRTLEDMLRCFCSDYMDRWDTLLIPLEFAYNDSKHAGTKETPFFLNYGRHPIQYIQYNTICHCR